MCSSFVDFSGLRSLAKYRLMIGRSQTLKIPLIFLRNRGSLSTEHTSISWELALLPEYSLGSSVASVGHVDSRWIRDGECSTSIGVPCSYLLQACGTDRI